MWLVSSGHNGVESIRIHSLMEANVDNSDAVIDELM